MTLSGTALSAGTVVGGDYRVVRPLAAGGMGAVYVAEQLSTGKLRALKLMHPSLVRDPKSRQRFEQEARVTARIESEHVVEVVGAGVDAATAMPWIAMELLEGTDLGAYLRQRGALRAAEVRELMGQLCHALAAAHRIGIVHRDLKPENVFIAKSRQQAVPFKLKVLDFGIAKVVADARTTAAATASIGTPRHMAPEQTDPNGHITPATDVWALGLIAFQLLTGRWYWRLASGGPGESLMMLMREVLVEPLVPASARAEEYGCAHLLPRGFDPWFALCVVRDPSARLRDAAQAMAALDPVLAAAAGGAPSWAVHGGGHAPAPVWPQQHAAVGATVPGQGGHPMTPPFGPSVPAVQTGVASYTANAPAASSAARASALPWIAVALGVLGVGALVAIGVLVVPRLVPSTVSTSPSRESPPTSGDLSGDYAIASSQNPGGGSYAGSVHLSRAGAGYRMVWTIANGGYEGVALPVGDTLAVGWAQGGHYGVIAYTIDGGDLHGRWITNDAPGSARVEELHGAPDLRGTYTIVKATGGYTGTVTINPTGETYALAWAVTGQSYRGVGIRRGKVLSVGWTQSGNVGVVSYDISGATTLVGRWSTLGDSRLGSETLERR